MLASQWQASSGIPVVFLHGLLGSQQDWVEVFALLQKFPQIRPLAIDLPFHADSQDVACHDFAICRELLHQTLITQISEPFFIVGYSLGGRIALDYAFHQQNLLLKGVILEGANIGLKTELEKQLRWRNDQHWAERFRHEPIQNMLSDWYQQPVFADLSSSKRFDFIQKRQNNDGKKIAKMLEATSLAKQPFFDCAKDSRFHFLIGEQDLKFRNMAEQNNLNYQLIKNAGHNAHQHNPDEFVEKLVQLITTFNH